MLQDSDRKLLVAIAAGRVQRGGDSVYSPYQLNGEDVSSALYRLGRADLVALPILGPPRLTPSGARALAIADH